MYYSYLKIKYYINMETYLEIDENILANFKIVDILG